MYSHDSTAHVACKNWRPGTTSGTYLPPNTREASYAISPIAVVYCEISCLPALNSHKCKIKMAELFEDFSFLDDLTLSSYSPVNSPRLIDKDHDDSVSVSDQLSDNVSDYGLQEVTPIDLRATEFLVNNNDITSAMSESFRKKDQVLSKVHDFVSGLGLFIS